MSLLLDALKKAAQEKLNNETEQSEEKTGLSVDGNEVDLSLTQFDQTSIGQDESGSTHLESDTRGAGKTEVEPGIAVYSPEGDLTEIADATESGASSETVTSLTDAELELEPMSTSDLAIEVTDIEDPAIDYEGSPRVSTTQLDRFLSGDNSDFNNNSDQSTKNYSETKAPAETHEPSEQKTYSGSLTENFKADNNYQFTSSHQHAAQMFGTKPKSPDTLRMYFLIGLVVLGILVVGGMFVYDYISQLNQNSIVAPISRARNDVTARLDTASANVEQSVEPALLIEQEDYNDVLKETLAEYEDEDITGISETDTPSEQETKPVAKKTVAGQAGEYSIKRRNVAKRESLQAVLNRAYKAYQDGDINKAETVYRQALTRSPRNRDALLGLGAVNMVKGDTQQAQRYYRQLLELNPKDDLALANLASLQKQHGAANGHPSELTRVKAMLNEKPDSPYLYFTMGNLLANSQRWPEAQQAYFNAYSLDAGNANYAFNLAVSLEHIGQAKAAIQYYHRAIELAEDTQALFSVDMAGSRIQALGQ